MDSIEAHLNDTTETHIRSPEYLAALSQAHVSLMRLPSASIAWFLAVLST